MIVYGLDKVTELPKGEVHLAIGMFDGVHLGHQKLIDSAIEAAKKVEGISAVLTFWPHPTRVFVIEHPTLTIMSPEIKDHFLEERGVDLVIQENFTKEFSKTSAKEFVRLIKKALPGLKTIYAGENFRFGRNREGDIEFLKIEGERLGFNVVQQPYALYKEEIISSSRIRKVLLEGKIEDANAMLGYPYYSIGMVIEKVAAKGQYPTLDIVWRPEMKPRYGVYAIRARVGKSKEFKGVANYGVAPTVKKDVDPMLQVCLFEATEWGPGDLICVDWLHFIRPEKKFETKEALKEQIDRDIEEAKNTLKYLF